MLQSLLAAVVSGEALASARRLKLAIILYSIVSLLVLIGTGFLVIAGYLYAASRYGSVEAALGFGAGFLFLGLVILLVFKITAAARARRAARQRKSELSTIAAATALAILPALLSRKSSLGLALAPILAAVGYQIMRENCPKRTPPSEGE